MSRSATSYHHGDLATSLESAAEALLTEGGKSALSLREVARRAGVSHNAPYHHFADRHALLARLGERHMRHLLQAQLDAAEAAADPRAALVAVGAAYVQYAADHPHGFALVFDPEVCEPGQTGPVMAELIEQNEQLLADLIGAVDPTLGDDEVGLVAMGAWGAAHGLAQLVAAGHLPVEPVPDAIGAYLGLGARLA